MNNLFSKIEQTNARFEKKSTIMLDFGKSMIVLFVRRCANFCSLVSRFPNYNFSGSWKIPWLKEKNAIKPVRFFEKFSSQDPANFSQTWFYVNLSKLNVPHSDNAAIH